MMTTDDYEIDIVPAYPKGMAEPAARWFWRCTLCAVGSRGSVGSAASEGEARDAGNDHVRRAHPSTVLPHA